MTDHEDRIDDAERRRQVAIEEFRKMRGMFAEVYEGPDPAGERSVAIRRLLTAEDPYEGLTGVLMENRQMSSDNLDLAALARRRLRALRGVKVRELDDRPCIAGADLAIEAMAWQWVFEAALSAENRELCGGAGSVAVRWLLAEAVEDLGDDDVYGLVAEALRHSGHPDPVGELREDLGL